MNYETFKVHVRKAGFDLRQFASLIGMNHRSISNYSRHGSVPEHLALISLLMVELERRDVDVKGIFAKLDQMGRRLRKPQPPCYRGTSGKRADARGEDG